MPRLAFHTADVFTTRRFAGNPLAIVEGADSLSTAQMQTIAREFNLSETIFVNRPTDPANTASVRIFFPTAEIPFAGHPTLGCAIHLATKQNPGGGDFSTRIMLEEVAGLVPVDVKRENGIISGQFTAPVIPHEFGAGPPPASVVAEALGIAEAEIGFGGHRIGLFAGGPVFLFVPVASRAVLEKAHPREPAWAKMAKLSGTNAAYLYTPGGDHADTAFRARMYSPKDGIPEDPATGSASAILAAQLLASGALAEGTSAFRLEQGYEMGRPSDIWMEADLRVGRISAVRISGSSVPVSSGEIEAV